MTADLWVFAYGSLMWRPGFAYRETRRARLTGYHRAFCVCSVHHRGTPGRIGLVLGLDRGGVCEGVAYRIDAQDVPEARAYLRARELVNGVYREASLPVELETTVSEAGSDPSAPTFPSFPQRSGEASALETTLRTTALAYIVERAHPTYAGNVPPAIQARLIRAAKGLSGANLDYLISTVRHLKALGIRERGLERLVTLVGPLAWTEARAPHTSPYAAGIVRTEQRRPPPLKLAARRSGGDFLFRLRLGQ
ncbi:MAG TPA: gamma-glutamylcyclotransferase [Hyphomicrobiaceae bacterium]|nr:gamma-glutamylcyclotransferase [Hyphomicrobiaceae bacterium]